MTDPTPTRAEVDIVERLRNHVSCIADAALHEAAETIAALRERAEAAERHKDAGWDQQRYWSDRYVNKTAALEKALVEARRAEAAAWNDAIEAVEALEPLGRRWISRARIRALRRAAPTEGEA